MAWSDEARKASIEARRRAAAQGQNQNQGAHQAGVAQVGKPVLSDKALNVIQQNPSGFSVTPNGDVPSKGYMVALAGRSQILDASALRGPGASDIINGYARQHADALQTPGAHIGGWEDSETGKVHLDVAHNIARQREAVKAGIRENQKAIYDVKRKREIRTGGTGDAY